VSSQDVCLYQTWKYYHDTTRKAILLSKLVVFEWKENLPSDIRKNMGTNLWSAFEVVLLPANVADTVIFCGFVRDEHLDQEGIRGVTLFL
jgi:hypothetical protein